MNLLFDASAIINLSHRNRPLVFMVGKTVSLAEYEIGNVIWKQVKLSGEISEEEGAHVLRKIVESVALMDIITVPRVEDTLHVACEEGLSYYDAYYITAAKVSGSVLVTDDKALLKKARSHVDALRSVDL
jgi:predicted nucleic acid-binding protein